MIKKRTATLRLADKEVSVTVCYIILWTGEDYEVTVFNHDMSDSGNYEYISRFNVESAMYARARVDSVLRNEIKTMINDDITIDQS